MIKCVLADELFAQMSSAAFRKHCVLGVQFHTGLISRLGLAIFAPAHLSRCNTFDTALIIKEHFTSGKAGINLYTQGLSLLAEPAYHLAEADNVITMVMHGARGEGIRNLDGFLRPVKK